MRRVLIFLAASTVPVAFIAGPALACGGLVAPNGAVRLQQTTTLAAYHAGVEHYVTSFEYAGGISNFGSIIPLPGVPTDVRRAGGWTLQRLEREVHPVPIERGVAEFAAISAPAQAQVLLQTTVDALDITVLSGGGPAVLDWVKAHGYAVSPDAPAMLDFYARRSPVFLAARFDAAAAKARGQLIGDGTPVQITIPTPAPWVPLHILSLAKSRVDVVQADVFLLTDQAPALLGVAGGVTVRASEPAPVTLLDDLRADRDSGWVPDQSWLTYVRIDTAAGRLDHDLAVDASGAGTPLATQAGYDPLGYVPAALIAGLHPVGSSATTSNGLLIALVVIAAMALIGVAVFASLRAERQELSKLDQYASAATATSSTQVSTGTAVESSTRW